MRVTQHTPHGCGTAPASCAWPPRAVCVQSPACCSMFTYSHHSLLFLPLAYSLSCHLVRRRCAGSVVWAVHTAPHRMALPTHSALHNAHVPPQLPSVTDPMVLCALRALPWSVAPPDLDGVPLEASCYVAPAALGVPLDPWCRVCHNCRFHQTGAVVTAGINVLFCCLPTSLLCTSGAWCTRGIGGCSRHGHVVLLFAPACVRCQHSFSSW